jgi:hypothetical protein
VLACGSEVKTSRRSTRPVPRKLGVVASMPESTIAIDGAFRSGSASRWLHSLAAPDWCTQSCFEVGSAAFFTSASSVTVRPGSFASNETHAAGISAATALISRSRDFSARNFFAPSCSERHAACLASTAALAASR